jgi:acyl-CoA thioesterase I
MFRRQFLIGVGAGLVSAGFSEGCGGPPIGPGGVTPPPPTPIDPPPPPPPPPSLSIGRILAFGDSMTAGTTSPVVTFRGLDAGLAQSYPFKLQRLLTARYSAQTVDVFNAGKPAERATDGRDRLGGVLSEAKPQLLLLMEGANDLNNLAPGSTNVSPAVGAMEDMVREASGRGVEVVVATIPPQRPGRPNTQQAALVPKYNSELKLMASKKGAMLVDVNASFPLSMIGQDGLHPTEAGYQAIAEIFLDAIKARYEVPASIATR